MSDRNTNRKHIYAKFMRRGNTFVVLAPTWHRVNKIRPEKKNLFMFMQSGCIHVYDKRIPRLYSLYISISQTGRHKIVKFKQTEKTFVKIM